MNAKTLEAVERHGRQLLAIFPNATERDPVTLCNKLRRVEAVAERHALMLCNDEAYCNQPESVHDDTIYRIHAGNTLSGEFTHADVIQEHYAICRAALS